MNDLWQFDLNSWIWIWLAGDSSQDPLGVYGELGVPSLETRPGGRNSHTMSLDQENQLLYVFGGAGYANQSWAGNISLSRFIVLCSLLTRPG